MGTSDKFCLRWNDFEANISKAFQELKEDKDFFDVTLACDDDQLLAHKVILSACSPFFRSILKRNRHEHPLLYLKGVKYADLVAVLNFMYHGEVNVAQEDLNSFLGVAEDLKVKGLTQNATESKAKDLSGPPLPQLSTNRIRERADKSEIVHRKPRPPPTTLPQSTYQPVEDDVQEIVPVKSEPIHIPAEVDEVENSFHPIQQEHRQSQPPTQNQKGFDNSAFGVVADPNVEYGEEYGDYESYEGLDTSYDVGNSGMVMNINDEHKDFESTINEALAYNPVLKAWECAVCGRSNSDKNQVRRHAEVHFKGFIHTCSHCGVEKKTSTALRVHIHRFHTKK